MNKIEELHVIKSVKGIEASVRGDTVTSLALLSILILAIEKETGISAEKILDVVGGAMEEGKKEAAKTPKKRVLELEVLGTPIVKWLQENSFPHGTVIVDSYGIRLVRDEIGISTREVRKDEKGSK